MTIAYRKTSYTLTLLKKFPLFIEDVFALEKDPINGKCVVHVLDCCKLPWKKVRYITLECNLVTDFSIIDTSPCNIIITTHSLKQLVQGFNFATGQHLWDIQGLTCNSLQPSKIAVNNNDAIYITDSKSHKIHLIDSSGVYKQVVVEMENKLSDMGSVLVYRQELLVNCSGNGHQKLAIFKISQ